MTAERQALELVGQSDEPELQRIAEFASVVAEDATLDFRRAATGAGGLAEIDVTEFRACGPVRGEHVFNASTHRPACFGLLLREDGKRRPGITSGRGVLNTAESRAAGRVDDRRIECEADAAAQGG